MSKLIEELKELCTASSFTIRDMAVWCGQNHSTIRTWMKLGTEPHPIKAKALKQSLDLLRQATKEMPDKLPVPVTVGFHGRHLYIAEVRDYALRKFSKAGSSKRGG